MSIAGELTKDNLLLSLSDVQLRIKDHANRDKIPIVSDAVGRFLEMLVSLTKPQNILELGGGIAYSTIWMARGNKLAKIVSLDSNKDRCAIMKKYLAAESLSSRVAVIHKSGLDFLADSDKKFNFIFLDVMKKEYPQFFQPILSSLKPQGMFVADNINFSLKTGTRNQDGIIGVREFIKLAQSSTEISCFYIDIGDGLLLGLKK